MFRYGNQTFIEDGENGYLIPSSSDHVEDEIKKAMQKRSANCIWKIVWKA